MLPATAVGFALSSVGGLVRDAGRAMPGKQRCQIPFCAQPGRVNEWRGVAALSLCRICQAGSDALEADAGGGACAWRFRPSPAAPERRIPASLLQVLFSVRPGRQRRAQVRYNLTCGGGVDASVRRTERATLRAQDRRRSRSPATGGCASRCRAMSWAVIQANREVFHDSRITAVRSRGQADERLGRAQGFRPKQEAASSEN